MTKPTDMSIKSGAVTIEAEPFGIVPTPELTEGPAAALALVVKQAIIAQPDSKWNRTGKLLSSVAVDGSEVVTSTDRLQRDELVERFDREVMPFDVSDDRRVTQAIEDAVDAMLGEEH
jgi:hypothetical protein